jgi:hypothetical protein
MPTLPFTPKLRRFGSFGPFLIFVCLFVFFFFKKKRKKKKKKGNRGWLEPPPCPKMGWPDHPLFGQGVASATPYGRYGVAEATPQAFGGGPATPKATKKKKKRKKKKMKWVCAVGGGRTTPKGLGWLRPPSTTTPRPLGVVRPPPMAQTHFVFFFFFFLGGFRGGRTTPKGLGVALATPYRPYGVAEATPWPKRGWFGHPIFGQGGGSSHPRFPLLFFFLISSLKKKKKTKIRNGPKLRRFGQNGIVLGEPKMV